MDCVRTPDERFAGLPGYDFAPHYTEVDDGEGGRLRIHHFEAGPADGEPVLLLHGQPSWSYLYRKMAPLLADAGYRVFAPDLVGFGRSDKPTERSDYTYANHVAWMSRWLEANDLRALTLFCQDWGGLIGLRLVAAFPERFARVVASNTALPDGFGQPPEAAKPMWELYDTIPIVPVTELGARFADQDGPPGFFYWRRYCAESPDFSVGDVMQLIAGGLSPEIRAGYEAPFPDERFVAGARQFPCLVPIFPDDVEIPANQVAWKTLESFDKPFLTAFSADDPVTAGFDEMLRARIPGAKGIAPVVVENAGHFLQETQGPVVAEHLIAFMRAHPAT